MNGVSESLALSLGAAWASGINLYAAVVMLGLLHFNGYIQLPPGLEILSSPLVVAVATIMYCIEFFVDKIPGLDSVWDAIHTFIRIPAGALMAAAAIGQVDPALQFAAGMVGGAVAASTHATKAGARVMINTSPEPFSNWFVSFAEDLAVIFGLWTVLHHPVLFLFLMIAFAVGISYLLPLMWKGIKEIFHGFRQLTRGRWLDSEKKNQSSPNV